jgi:Zn-dependent M28 family amino/carboxypeptidase
VQAHANELSDLRFYLNMDSAGSQRNERDIVLNEWPGLEALFEGWSEEMALGFKVAQSAAAFSDHFPFFMAGVATGGIQSAVQSLAGRGYGHTQYDTVDKVDSRSLREASTLAARLAMRIANEESWPVARRNEAAVAEVLDTPDNRELQAFREEVDAFYKEARKA